VLSDSDEACRSDPHRIGDIQPSIPASGRFRPRRSAEHYRNRNSMRMRCYAHRLLRTIVQQFRAIGNVIQIGRKQDQ
jgi:hypothetical protein